MYIKTNTIFWDLPNLYSEVLSTLIDGDESA